MKKLINAAVVVCVSIALIYGCDSTNNPVSQNESDRSTGVLGSVTGESNLINNYNVKFNGRKFDNGKTTFSYSVSHNNGPSSNNFYLQIPDCAVDNFDTNLLGLTPDGPVKYPYNDPISKTKGVLWNSSLSRGTSEFSISFNGEIPIGSIYATVISGNKSDKGKVPGPCEGYIEEVKKVEITGLVFVDIDGNKVKNTYETGLYKVVVELVDSDDISIPTTTDLSGNFKFEVPAGNYTVRIPDMIGEVEFNKNFFESYDFVGFSLPFSGIEPELDIQAQDDVSGINFAFNGNMEALIEKFTNKTILTNTQDVEFWRKNVRAASSTAQGNFDIKRADIYNYLNKIEDNDFFPFIVELPDNPFNFGPRTGSNMNIVNRARAQVALDIMFNPSPNRTEKELFLQELLAAEFNIVSGKYGVGGFKVDSVGECSTNTFSQNGTLYCPDNIAEFHLALLAFGEGYAAALLEEVGTNKLSTSTITNLSLSEVTTVFSTFNRTGSGGLN